MQFHITLLHIYESIIEQYNSLHSLQLFHGRSIKYKNKVYGISELSFISFLSSPPNHVEFSLHSLELFHSQINTNQPELNFISFYHHLQTV